MRYKSVRAAQAGAAVFRADKGLFSLTLPFLLSVVLALQRLQSQIFIDQQQEFLCKQAQNQA